LLLVSREFESDKHAASLKNGGRLSLNRRLSFLCFLLVSLQGISVLDSDFRFNLPEVMEHRDVDRVNFSSGPSHLSKVNLRLSDSTAFHHSGSHIFLPCVLAEVRADRV
jgi:hypothetical protein